VGSRAGTYQLTVAAADSTTLTGEDAILLTVLAAPPSTATLSPITLAITPGTRETRAIVVAVADSFGNPVARQSVQLRPPPSRPVFPVQLHRTSDSGTARFELPTAALRAGDTLTVVANGRVLASLPVTAAERVVARAKEAPPRAAAQSSAPRPADERLPDVDPSDAAALTARAESRSVAGDYSGARRDLDAALRAGADRGTVLTVLGYNSLRGGDYAAAADQFQQALRADPRHAAAATGLAYAELWRDDPRQASRRFDVLRSSPPPSYPADAAEKFRDGIARAARRDLTGAERALSAAVAAAPSWADAYYNRALVLEATDQAERAAPDFRRYLQLRPAASDRSSVARRITVLGRTPVDALTRGLMAPGLGQFYTGRPAIGAAVLAGVVGSTALALNQRTTTETRTFTNPFGRRYTDEVTVTKRPHLTAGLAAAGAIWLLGAMEASLHVANARGDVSLPSTPSSRAGTESRLRLLPVVALEPTGPAFGAAAVVGFR
jgi:tetratricopeptide (TPR) repeat protein